MTNLPKNLPALLRAEGLKVVEIPGWRKRGRPARTGSFRPVGVLWHHTGGPANGGRAYAAGILTQGRNDLPGPLCHLSIDGDGVVYVVAAGRANHAGKAKAAGTVAGGDGNSLYVGIEIQNLGTTGYSHAQYRATVVATKVLLTKVTKTSVRTVHAHYETSVTGKWDPGNPKDKGGVRYGSAWVLNMDKVRSDVQEAVKPPKRLPTDKQVAKNIVTGKPLHKITVQSVKARTNAIVNALRHGRLKL